MPNVITPSIALHNQFPQNIQDHNPNFVLFMKKYYEWMYKDSGFTKDEIDYVIAQQNWLTTDIEKYLETGAIQYSGVATQNEALIQMSGTKHSGAWLDNAVSAYFLEREFEKYTDINDVIFETADGYDLETPKFDENYISLWLARLGYDSTYISRLHTTFDQMLMIRNLKLIYSIKGTFSSIQLFFNMYFDEVVTIYNPKFDIAVIDSNFQPDYDNYIRDDNYYNEYSYVIYVSRDPSHYTEQINNIYMKYIHPAGFKMFLIQNPL